MKKFISAAAVLLAATTGAWAGGDKGQDSYVDNTSVAGGSAGFTNGVSSGKSKSGSCKLQIQLKGLTGYNDGDILICIAEADIRAAALGASAFGNSVVMRGAVKSGQLKIKADFTAIGCASTTSINWNSDVKCYAPDANYTNLSNDAVNWKNSCTTAGGMVPIPNAEATPASDPAKVNLLGLCQGLTPNVQQRINPPASALICRQGATIPQDI